MSSDIAQDTRTAIYTQLKSDAVLMGKITGVFIGQADSNQALPYISIAAGTYPPWDSFQNIGFEPMVVVDVWTTLNSGDVYASILADCYRLLHHPVAKLPLTTFISVDIEIESSTSVDDQVNQEKHGVLKTHSWAQSH